MAVTRHSSIRPRITETGKLTADQAAKLRDLARLMDDAEGARTGCDSGLALILKDISFTLYESWPCARKPSVF